MRQRQYRLADHLAPMPQHITSAPNAVVSMDLKEDPHCNSFSILRLYNEVDEQLAIQEKSCKVYGKYAKITILPNRFQTSTRE